MDDLITLNHKDKLQIHITVPMNINDVFYKSNNNKAFGTLLGSFFI